MKAEEIRKKFFKSAQVGPVHIFDTESEGVIH